MPEYDPDAEVTAKYMIAFVDAAGEVSSVFKQTAQETLEEHLGELNPEKWYRLEDCVAALDDVHDQVGPTTITKGGVAAAKALPIQDELSLEEAIEELKAVHDGEGNVRNSKLDTPAGQYVTDIHEDRSARLAVNNSWPLPKPWAKGVYKGVIERWGPDNAIPSFDETTAREDESFAWNVEW